MLTSTLPVSMIFIMVVIVEMILCSYSDSDSDSDSSYSYKSPVYGMKNPNVTFAMPGPTKTTSEDELVYGNMFAAVCQADKINRGVAGINFQGNINLILQKFTSIDFTGQQATQSLFKNNLYNDSSTEAVYGNNTLPIGGFFSFSGTGSLRINSAISNGFLFPFVFAGTETGQNPDNLFVGRYPSENTTNYQIRDTLVYNSFNAILDVLNYFKWTLVGTIFESNSYGYNMQELVQTYQSQAFYPNFACSVLFSPDISLNTNGTFDSYYREFCGCIGDKDSISVVVLWTTTSSATEMISSIHLACPQSKKWTFIITNDPGFDLNDNYATDILKNSLVLRQFGPWDFSGFMDECLDTASPAAKPVLEQLSSELYANTYNCIRYKDVNQPDINLCPESIVNRKNTTCFCTGNEVKDDSYASNFYFSADAVTLYGEAMSLLQNNCTFLNENLGWGDEGNNLKRDFCAMVTFEPSDLTAVMRLVNFVGYTGSIGFGSKILKRLTKKFYLYSLPMGVSTAELVGVLSVGSVQINESAISFVDNTIPTSMIIPQNPNLSYAVVDVFFAFAVVTLIVSLVVLVLFIVYRNDPAIRRNAPYVTILMIVGVIFGSVTVILDSFGLNDVMCALDLFTFTGFFALIISGLIVKNFRIYRIFTNNTAQSIRISEISLLLVMLVVLAYFWILNTLAVVFGYGTETLSSSTNPYYQYVTCVLPDSTWNAIFERTLEISTVILLLVILIFAWLTRKINDQYSESKEMAAFFALYFAIFIVFLPLYDTLGTETDSELFRYIIRAELVLVGVVGALLILFIPKLYIIYKKRNRNSNSNRSI